jgi:7-alpha-hydroxysteroid dehydrogenase
MGRSLEGKTAVVTGSGRGIGAAIALAFAREGADVVLSSRSQNELDAVKAQIVEIGRKAVTVVADMADAEQVRQLGRGSLEAFGGLDILVNNAGFSEPLGAFLDVSTEMWTRAWAVNLDAAMTLIRIIAPHFVEKKSGNIINVSTIRGTMGSPTVGAYGAAKSALNSITKTFACELGPTGVRVNAIVPGMVRTSMIENALHGDIKLMDRFAKLAPLKRWVEPEDCAGAAVFLASDAARGITGHLLAVDAGLSSLVHGTFLSIDELDI